MTLRAALASIDRTFEPLRNLAQNFAAPLLDLVFRLYVAHTFFRSGLLRLKDAWNGTWDRQIFLFEFEHPVPGLDPALASLITTAGELTLPVLVAFGLMSRLGAAGLLAMAVVIQLTYQQNPEHLLWIALMISILIRGPGPLSLDRQLVRWLRRSDEGKPS